jgi:hypothetical protein
LKSFSSASFASDHTEVLQLAQAAVAQHPQALFTDFQWFLFAGRDTVFYTAYSRQGFDRDKLTNLVAEMVALAPQLTHGFVGAKPGQPFAKHLLDAITSVEVVEEFDGFPDSLLSRGTDLFERDDIPLFRVTAFVRRNGPDAQGRQSLILVRSAHALMEGSDSALLTRSQSAGHGIMSDKSNKVGIGSRAKGLAGAWGMALMQLIVANLFAPKDKPMGFSTLAISRHRLRQLSRRLGVRTRSLMFALVTFALNGEGPQKAFSRKVIAAAYTMLDAKRNAADDDFFRVRALFAKLPWRNDFVDYVKAVDDAVDKVEQKDISRFQVLINAMFSIHRRVQATLPWLYGPRFWRYAGPGHIVLTLVPPHRTYGDLTAGVIEPIFCGAYHAAVNLVTFCPARQYVTLSFSMETRHLDNVGKIAQLLDRVEAMDLPEPTKTVVEREEV